MAIWYEVEKTEHGLLHFHEANWEFHDFRIARITYFPEHNMIDIYLQYDTKKEGRLLRFYDVSAMHIEPVYLSDYPYSWMEGTLIWLEDDNLVWVDSEFYSVGDPELKKAMETDFNWVKSRRLFWAFTDAAGLPIEMPSDLIEHPFLDNNEEYYETYDLKEAIELPWNVEGN